MLLLPLLLILSLCSLLSPSYAAPPSSLYAQLSSLRFLNNGTTYSHSQYGYQDRTVLYGEVENVTTTEFWWGPAEATVPVSVPILYEKPHNATPPAKCGPGSVYDGQDMRGNDMATVVQTDWSVDECRTTCCQTDGCVAFTLAISPVQFMSCQQGQLCCFLKHTVGPTQPATNMTSGTVSNPLMPEFTLHPSTGMRSAVPLGGASCGSVELRADGTFHEWTIVNQSPAGAAKYGVVDESLMAVRSEPVDGSGNATAFTLRTHPPAGLPGVSAMRYHGAYPASRLDILEPSLAVDTSVYAYFALKPTDLNRSATPSFTLSANVHNPTSRTQQVSFMWTLPMAVEKDVSRLNGSSYAVNKSGSAFDCMTMCQQDERCQSWTYAASAAQCSLAAIVPLNYYQLGYSSGVKGVWRWRQGSATGSTNSTTASTSPLQYVQSVNAGGPTFGDVSLWPVLSTDGTASIDYTLTVGVHNSLTALYSDFADDGQFELPDEGTRVGAIGGAAVSARVPAGASVTLSVVFSWYFPHRDHLYENIGNYYQHLFHNSIDVGQSIVQSDGSGLSTVVNDILGLHSIYYNTTLPDYLIDSLVNTFSHLRSAMWAADGTWRQWEAYDCVDVDSIHNDYQRHIPYILYFPDTEMNKLRQHAANQIVDGSPRDGMLNEYLSNGCIGPVGPWNGAGGGREMGDVTTLFIAEVWELYAWTADMDFVRDMYPHVKRAVQWQIRRSPDGLPTHLVSTYDIVGLETFEYTTFNSVLHLLAMRAAMRLAELYNDTATYDAATIAFNSGAALLQSLLWNNASHYYQSFWDNSTDGSNVVFADSLYGQVVAWTLGLDDLLPREQMLDHLFAEELYNDSPYGLIVQTGLEEPSNTQDNAIWMGGSQDWTAAAIRLGLPLQRSYPQAEKGMNNWRLRLNDLWNVWGLAGGIGLGMDGLHWCTSHYGFHMVLWHTPFSVSGQLYFAPNHSLTFSPAVQAPYSLPILIPNALGRLDVLKLANGSEQYTVTIMLGQLHLDELRVHAVSASAPGLLRAGMSVSWSGHGKDERKEKAQTAGKGTSHTAVE